jgi:hypothetical protein
MESITYVEHQIDYTEPVNRLETSKAPDLNEKWRFLPRGNVSTNDFDYSLENFRRRNCLRMISEAINDDPISSECEYNPDANKKMKQRIRRYLAQKFYGGGIPIELSVCEDEVPLELEAEFNERADRWQKDTGMHSSPTKRFMHEDYQTIMAMGEAVIPLILGRLQEKPGNWFWALKHLAKQDVARGIDNFDEAVEAWLQWGVTEGYLRR